MGHTYGAPSFPLFPNLLGVCYPYGDFFHFMPCSRGGFLIHSFTRVASLGQTLDRIDLRHRIHRFFCHYCLFLRLQWARLAQIVVIIVFGTLVTVFVTPRGSGGDLMFVLAAVMAYKYGFFQRGFLPKIVIIVGALIATRMGLVVFTDKLQFRQAIGHFAMAIGIIPIVYWVFEDELRRTTREKQRLEALARNNQPFVEFGRNVSGIVHDFKNDLGLFSMFGQLLRINRGDPISEQQIVEYEGYVQRLSGRIERILAVTRVSHHERGAFL